MGKRRDKMTMPTRYVRTPDGRLVAVPAPVAPTEEVEPTPEEEVEPRDDGFSDILDVTEEDIIGTEGVALPEEEDNEDLFSAPEEDTSDLFGVNEEEAMEYPPKPKKPKIRRTTKYYPPPPTTLGGMR